MSLSELRRLISPQTLLLTVAQLDWEKSFKVRLPPLFKLLFRLPLRPGIQSHIFQRWTSTLPRQRGINCPICNQPESFLHINFECPFVQQVARLIKAKCKPVTATLKLSNSNWFALRVFQHDPWFQATIQWSLWKFRNALLKGNDHQDFKSLLLLEFDRQALYIRYTRSTLNSENYKTDPFYFQSLRSTIEQCNLDLWRTSIRKDPVSGPSTQHRPNPSAPSLTPLASCQSGLGATGTVVHSHRTPLQTGQLPVVRRGAVGKGRPADWLPEQVPRRNVPKSSGTSNTTSPLEAKR